MTKKCPQCGEIMELIPASIRAPYWRHIDDGTPECKEDE